jgi:Mrp family chromosome partitioning ATPase
MPRMLDMIRNSQVPSTLMHSAAHGALSVPPEETIEILVHLALHNKLFGAEARLTLAGWDEKASLAAAADPNTSAEVLGYFASVQNLRITLLAALAENPSVSEESLDEIVVSGSRSTVEALLKSRRVTESPRMLQAMQSNPNLHPQEQAEIGKKLAAFETNATEPFPEAEAPDEIVEFAVIKYLEENAEELAAEQDKPFLPIGIFLEETGGEATVAANEPQAPVGVMAGTPASGKSATAAAVAVAVAKSATGVIPGKKHPLPANEARRDSTLQKISKLDIKGRIALAMRGSKEDRSILIRDSTKLVAAAVLESPKVSEGEVEKFALQKNVLQSVLRAIPMKRKFAKNYNITRNLVYNPRTPLDLSLGLMKNLLIHDLKNLSANKEVSDTVRKLATRMFKQKLEKKG